MEQSDYIGKPDISEEDRRELSTDSEQDHMRFEQRRHLALAFSHYLDVPVTRDAHWKRSLGDLLAALGSGGAAVERTTLVALMNELKQYGKRLHYGAPRHTPRAPRDLGHLLYTLASAVALVGADQHIHNLGPNGLAGNVAWALKQPWLDDRLLPILHQAQARLGDDQGKQRRSVPEDNT
jgi:hypothetical protein